VKRGQEVDERTVMVKGPVFPDKRTLIEKNTGGNGRAPDARACGLRR